MKCPKCNQEQMKYDQHRKKTKGKEPEWKRTDFNATCLKCGFKGEIR